MEVKDAIIGRRSIRRFLDRPIEEEKIESLIEAVRWAPSAGNLQARFFYFVMEKGLRERIAELSLRQAFIAAAPVVVVACADHKRIRPYGERGYALYAIQDVAASIENLMLQAHEEGLGSVWVGAFDEEAIAASLDMPEYLRPLAIIPVGYPAGLPSAPPRLSKKDLVKIVR